MTKVSDADDRSTRRAHVEALLRAYPNIDHEETAKLIRWFHKEASALDVGLIASEPSLAAAYRQLKKDHLDRFSRADLVRAFLAISLVAACLMSIIWLSF